MPTFIITREGEVLGTHLINKKAITIGRAKDNTICISNSAVSRHHIKIEKQGKCFVLQDTGSLNGTFVNDNMVKNIVLSSGDKIGLGKYIITFEEKEIPSAQDTDSVQYETRESTIPEDKAAENNVPEQTNQSVSTAEIAAKLEEEPDGDVELGTELAHSDPFIVKVIIKGTISGKAEKKFRMHIEGLFMGGTNNMILDLSAVQSMSSPAWKFLIQQRKRARENEGDLILASISQPLLEQYKNLGFDKNLDIFNSCNDALKAFPSMNNG